MGSKNRRLDEEKLSKNRKNATKDLNKDINSKSQPSVNRDVNIRAIPSKEKEDKLPSIKLLLLCATFCGLINSYYVSTLFENDRHFSHLSTLEREMSFRTEMALYYSYYKTVVEADSFLSGLNKLIYDNKTEYPDTINTLQRFNLLPEVVLGGTYRAFTNVLSFAKIELPRTCWSVSRGSSLPPVYSCEGIGEPIYWYLWGVWICAGFTVALLFLSGVQLSHSLIGGFITVACFFFNHGEATRVQWTPPLRESFAFPFSLALNMIITYSLREPKVSWVQPLLFGNVALNYLLCWQFSQFTLVANILILYALYTIGLSPPLPMLLALLGALYALANALIAQFANSMLLASPLAGVLVGVFLLYVFIEPLIQTLPAPTNIGVQLAFLIISSIASKVELARFLSIEDDEHIINLLKSKFTEYSDFHTKLYTCSKEFDFLPKETIDKLKETLLLPSVIIVVVAVFVKLFFRLKHNLIKRMEERERDRNSKTGVWSDVDAGLIFNLILLVFYGVLAGLIMRLKLFLTPHLCVVASLLASRSLWKVIRKKEIHYCILIVLIGSMCVRGIGNIREQLSIKGEYSEPHLEELLEWIKAETGEQAAFAGPMPIMANILLSTRRPVVNHPHYENAALRHRTKIVYSIFSRKKPEEVYENLLSLKVNYVVLEESWCTRRSKKGCGLVDLWDAEEPQRKHLSPLCPKLFHHNASPFHRIFSNEGYVVLQVPSKYVEIPAPRVLSS